MPSSALVMLNDVNPFYSILIRVVYRLLTAGFFHVGFLHVVMNMLAFQVRTAHTQHGTTHTTHTPWQVGTDPRPGGVGASGLGAIARAGDGLVHLQLLGRPLPGAIVAHEHLPLARPLQDRLLPGRVEPVHDRPLVRPLLLPRPALPPAPVAQHEVPSSSPTCFSERLY
jgi:hypothetical protein